MLENLIRFDLHCGFNCAPALEAERYEGEVLEGERVLQDPAGRKPLQLTESNSSRLGEMWMRFEDGQMSWHVNCIVRDGMGDGELSDLVLRMHGALESVLKFSLENLRRAIGEFSVPDGSACLEMARESLGESVRGGGVSLSESELADLILVSAKGMASEASRRDPRLSGEGFASRCGAGMTEENAALLLRGVTVIRRTGGRCVFSSPEQRDSTVRMLAMKLSGDIAGRYLEDMESK